jgi:pimeloyl-ACP methyl ester carboxylesterase
MNQKDGVEFATTPLLSTGVRLRYAERGDPRGEAIVLLHGYSDSWFSFSGVLPLLSPSYLGFALTQRGHGDSDKPECCYTPHDYAADVDAFMEAVGIDEATLVGASTGALFAQRVTLSYPRRVSRLVLIASQTPAHENEALSGLLEEVRALEDPVPPEFVRGVPGEHHPPSAAARVPRYGGLREPQTPGPGVALLPGAGGALDRSGLCGGAC